MSIFHQLGESDAEASAQQFTEMTRRAIEKEKQLNKSSKTKKRRLRKANTVSRATGLTLSNLATAEHGGQPSSRPPRPQRVRPPLAVDGIVTLTAAQRTEFEKMKRQATMRSSEMLASTCIFENPAYIHLQEEYQLSQDASNPDPRPVQNEYYQQWMQQRMSTEVERDRQRQQEAVGGMRRSMSPVFSDSGWSHTRTPGLSPESQQDWSYSYPYTFGGELNLHSPQRDTVPLFFTNGIPSPPVLSDGGFSDNMQLDHEGSETDTDYTSVRDEDEEEEEEEGEGEGVMVTVATHANHDRGGGNTAYLQQPQVVRSVSSYSILGSERHFQELKKLSQDFTQPAAVRGLELGEGVDKEWEQWIKMQEDE